MLSNTIRVAFVLLLMFVAWAFYYQYQQTLKVPPSTQSSGLGASKILPMYKWSELLELSHVEPERTLAEIKNVISNNIEPSPRDMVYQYLILNNISYQIKDSWIDNTLDQFPSTIKDLPWLPPLLAAEKALHTWNVGDKGQGLLLMEEAIEQIEKQEFWFLMPRLLNWAGNMALFENEILQAQKYLLQAKYLSERRSNEFAQSVSHYNLFKIYFRMEQWQQALFHIQSARRLSEQLPEPNSEMLQVFWYNETVIYSQLGQYEAAKNAYINANKYFLLGTQSERNRVLDLRGQATIAMMENDYDNAKQKIDNCILAASGNNFHYSSGRCFTKLAQLELDSGHYQHALAAVDAGLDSYNLHDSQGAILVALKLKMRIFEAQGDFESAYSLSNQIYKTEKSQLHNKLRDLTHAQEAFELARQIDELNYEVQLNINQLSQTNLYLTYAKWLGACAVFTILLMYIRTHLVKRENARLVVRSSVDQLTGLHNRHYYYQQLVKGEAISLDQNYHLALLDIDHFKAINDTYGHLVGDEVLRQLAKLIKPWLHPQELFVRWGGEEFLLLLKADGTTIERLEWTLKTLAITRFSSSEGELTITSSIGVSRKAKPAQLLADESYFLEADECLYLAKQQGRNQVVTCQE